METLNDIVREVAAEMLNTSMQDITAERIHGWATRLGATCQESLQVQSVTNCNQHETLDIESRCIYGEAKDAEPVGNAAKMREALRKCANYLDVGDAGLSTGEVRAMYEVMQEALSAPARNCDKFTTFADALEAWRELDPREAGVFDEWLFAEAKGGEKNG